MQFNIKRLVKNFFSLLVLRGFEFLIPLITIPYLLRTIGVEKYGMIGFGNSFSLYFGAIVQYGFGVTATRDIARKRNNEASINQIYSNVLTTSALLGIAAVMIATLILMSVPALRKYWPLFILSLGQTIVQSLFPIWLFQGMERMSFITIISTVSKIAFIFGLFLIVHAPSDYIYVPLLGFASAIIVFIYSLWIVSHKFNVTYRLCSISSVSKTLLNGRHAFINQLVPNLYNNTTMFLLGLYTGGYAVGLYSSATKIVDAASSIGYILSNTFLPYLSINKEHFKLFKRIMLYIGFAGSLTILGGADLIGRLLHKVDGPAIAALLRYASPSILMIFVMLTFGTNYLMLRNRESEASKIYLYTSLVFFAISNVMVPMFGVIGCIITLVGARASMAGITYLYYRKSQLSE